MQQFKPNIQSNLSSRETSPNRGESKADVKAISADRQAIKEWVEKAGIDTSKQIRLVKISHMRYQHPDLGVLNKFMRGTSVQAYTILIF